MQNRLKFCILAMISLLTFIVFMISSTVKPYGYFIDEVYFVACTRHMAWGYIDQPPLSIALLKLMYMLFGTGITVTRILPALSISATVFVTGLIVHQLKGDLLSMVIAAVAASISPVFLIFGSFYSMNAFEPLIWALVVWYSIKMVRENNTKYWLHIGILMGLGLEMKHTIVLYGVALLVGLLISSKRKLLFTKWSLWGGLACFLIILPNIIWQIIHGFPSLELYANSFLSKNINKSYLQVFIEQVLFINPFTFPLWMGGLVFTFLIKDKSFRYMGFAYLLLLFIMMKGHSSRPDRIASIYIFFNAVGAVALSQWKNTRWKNSIRIGYLVILLAGGILLAPAFMPLMKPQPLKKYLSELGLHFSVEEGKKDEPIPQWLADRIGWPNLAEEVAEVYRALPENERKNAVIVSSDYGTAGALEIYGPPLGLPPVYATHNSFHSWGPPSDTVKTFIGVSIDVNGVRDKFDQVEQVKVYHCADCTHPQQNMPIYVLTGPEFSMEKEWKNFKHYQ